MPDPENIFGANGKPLRGRPAFRPPPLPVIKPPVLPLAPKIQNDAPGEFTVGHDRPTKRVVVGLPFVTDVISFSINDAMAFRNALDEQITILTKP